MAPQAAPLSQPDVHKKDAAARKLLRQLAQQEAAQAREQALRMAFLCGMGAR